MGSDNASVGIAGARVALTELQAVAKKSGGNALILGKGPSSKEWSPSAYSDRIVFGINEASNKLGVDFAFSVDTNNFSRLRLLGTPRFITCLYPHVEKNYGGLIVYKPDGRKAEEFGAVDSLIFNLGSSPQKPEYGPTIEAGNFSSSVLIDLLLQAGFNDIVLVGVDGGEERAAEFIDGAEKKHARVQNSYNSQFKDILAIKRRYSNVKINSFRSHKNSILIGAEAEQCLAAEVLKYSLERRTFLELNFLEYESVPTSAGLKISDAGTPFSFQRLALPEMANRQGRAIYLDSDMLVFNDIYEIFNWDLGNKNLIYCEAPPGRQEQFSFFLVNAESADWNCNELTLKYVNKELTYQQLLGEFSFEEEKAAEISWHWNSQELFLNGLTKNLHYTDMGTQPWLTVYNPNSDLWVAELLHALDNSASVRAALRRSLDRGWVRPSLALQLESGILDSWSLPAKTRRLDRNWTPPHMSGGESRRITVRERLRWKAASMYRRMYQKNAARRARRILERATKLLSQR